MLNKFIDLERLTAFFQGLKDIFLQKDEASTTYATKTEVENKVDKVEGKGLSTLDYDKSEKSKVDNSINQISVTQNTNNVQLNLSKISGDVTAYINEATSAKAGALSNTDKAKLDEIPTNPKYTDTIYTHPTNHSADMITESTTKRFVSDSEKTTWNNKQDKLTAGTNVTITGTTISSKDTTYDIATTSANGLMSSADKTKLDGVETGAQKNSITSVQGRTGAVTISKSDVGLGSVNNVAITAAQVTKINELNYTRAMTQAQYDALSQAEKDRLDVWYGIYEE